MHCYAHKSGWPFGDKSGKQDLKNLLHLWKQRQTLYTKHKKNHTQGIFSHDLKSNLAILLWPLCKTHCSSIQSTIVWQSKQRLNLKTPQRYFLLYKWYFDIQYTVCAYFCLFFYVNHALTGFKVWHQKMIWIFFHIKKKNEISHHWHNCIHHHVEALDEFVGGKWVRRYVLELWPSECRVKIMCRGALQTSHQLN